MGTGWHGELEPGTVLDGKYRITDLLGRGGMGAVYAAAHVRTGGRVAVKVIISQAVYNEELIARFQREARAAGSIETQHITRVLDTGVDPRLGVPFMAMEYLDGEDVLKVLERVRRMHPELALRIVAQASLGLQKAHESQVVHRDIKPANLFLARLDAGDRIVKLLDFGIAKSKMEQAQATDGAGLTRTGSMLGSPLYMSPEQALGARTIDHRTDIWSLGVVLYQCLSGTTPFQHLTALGEVIVAICSQAPQPLLERAPWVDPRAAEIAHKAMAHNPAQRFQSAAEMRHALLSLLPHGNHITEQMLVPFEPPAHVRRRRAGAWWRPLLVAGGVASTAALAGGLWAAGSRKEKPVVPAPVFTPTHESKVPTPPVEASATATETVIEATLPDELTFELTILPGDASVEVGSQPVPVTKGKVAISGVASEKKIVHVHKGSQDKTVPVTIGPDGLVPPTIRLDSAAPPPGPSGSGTRTELKPKQQFK